VRPPPHGWANNAQQAVVTGLTGGSHVIKVQYGIQFGTASANMPLDDMVHSAIAYP
jgi:hypothetical protein